MRTVPEPIKLALADASLPIKKRLLLYRRKWNADTLKYALETKPIDVTDLLIEAGSIKMALDTDEVDKWDASNVTLIFNNDLNCFKEGLIGGLFENAVLWGSKVVYNIETAEKGAPTASITVFTGFVYSSPVFRDNGNRLELTVTSSLDALEYVSAESFCLTKTDELATAVTSQDSKDQGKEFATAETGVGYVDEVKYGADFESAQTLSAGNDYDLSDTNEYTKPAVVKLKFTPTVGYKMWLSYRYWHKDMAIEDIVNALLDLAGVEKRQVEKAALEINNNAIQHRTEKPIRLMMEETSEGVFRGVWDNIFRGISPYYNHPLITVQKIGKGSFGALHTGYGCYLPSKNSYFHLGHTLGGILIYAAAGNSDWASYDFVTDDKIGLRFKYEGYSSAADLVVYPILNYDETSEEKTQLGAEIFRLAGPRAFVGFDFSARGLLSVYTCRASVNSNAISPDGGPVEKTETTFSFDGTFTKMWNNLVVHQQPVANPNCFFTNQLGWRKSALSTDEIGSRYIADFYNTVFAKSVPKIYQHPGLGYDMSLPEDGTKWRSLEYHYTRYNAGAGIWNWCASDNGNIYSLPVKITNGEQINSDKKYLWLLYSATASYELLGNIDITNWTTGSMIPLVNLSGLSVGAAIQSLAKLVAYEIGFNQDGVFFFRSRQGVYTEVSLTPDKLIEVDNYSADVENRINRVSASYGNYSSRVDDFTEQKSRPNSIDQYGLFEKHISDDNLLPPDNVDVAHAIAKANYETLSIIQAGYLLQAECRPDLSLELGDKITVCAENTNIAAKTWSDYNKFLKLPVWKRVFKITGLELSFAKRLMTLTLKDVTTAADVPTMEYNVYQTQFPTPLNYKE